MMIFWVSSRGAFLGCCCSHTAWAGFLKTALVITVTLNLLLRQHVWCLNHYHYPKFCKLYFPSFRVKTALVTTFTRNLLPKRHFWGKVCFPSFVLNLPYSLLLLAIYCQNDNFGAKCSSESL